MPAPQTETAAGASAADQNGQLVRAKRTGDGGLDAVVEMGFVDAGDEFAGLDSPDDLMRAFIDENRTSDAPAPEAKAPAKPSTMVDPNNDDYDPAPALPDPAPVAAEQPEQPETEPEQPAPNEELDEESQRLSNLNLLADRPRIKDRVTAMAVNLQRLAADQGDQISLAEAEARAKAALGIKDPEPATGEPAPDPGEVRRQIAEMEREFERLAFEEVEVGAAEAKWQEIQQLRATLPAVEQREAETQRVHAQRAAERFNSALDRAFAAYPAAADEASPLHRRANEILSLAPQGSYFDDPYNAVVAAADELRIPPGTPKAARPAPPKPSSPSPVSPPKGPQPMSARSTANPAATAQASLEDLFRALLVEQERGFTVG